MNVLSFAKHYEDWDMRVNGWWKGTAVGGGVSNERKTRVNTLDNENTLALVVLEALCQSV